MSTLGHFQILTLLLRILAKNVRFSWNFNMSWEMYKNYFSRSVFVSVGVYDVFDWKKSISTLFSHIGIAFYLFSYHFSLIFASFSHNDCLFFSFKITIDIVFPFFKHYMLN